MEEKAGLLEAPLEAFPGGYGAAESAVPSLSKLQEGIATEAPANANNLGVFRGVFVPTMLGIFGVVTFLRLPWVVGQAGLILAYAIVVLGNCCTTLTWASLSAISTNGKLKGGGAYYMISRSLGPEFGASIGLIFYFANVFGSGVYIKGFVEATQAALDGYEWYEDFTSYWTQVALGSLVLLALVVTCFFGAANFTRFMVLVWVFEVAALYFGIASFAFQSAGVMEGYTGWNVDTFTDNLSPHYQPTDGVDQSFQTVFAVFFPAMAGIMGGANMSGDLAEPGRSIPVGTIAAIMAAFATYILAIFVMAFTTTAEGLASSYYAMQDVSFWAPIITLGVYCAALSSGLTGITGGGRILQALARDNLVPGLAIFGRGFGKGDEPHFATIVTWFLVQILMFFPSLNTLATISSLFFLFSYGITNLACFALQIAGAPNFRPTFKYFTWYTSLAGTLLCFASGFLVSYVLATLSSVAIVVIFLYIYFTAPEREWGDVKQALIFHQVRKFLLRLDIRKVHTKHWRPSILLLVRDAECQWNLIHFVNNLKKGGMYLISSVLPTTELTPSAARTHWQSIRDRLNTEVIERRIKAFPEIITASSFRAGSLSLLQVSGVGLLKPNTVVLAFPSTAEPNHSPRGPPRGSPVDHPSIQDVASDDTDIEDDDDDDVCVPPGARNTAPPPDLIEYFGVVRDAILYEKNVLITRHFDGFDQNELASFAVGSGNSVTRALSFYTSSRRKTIDCWAVLPSAGEGLRSPSLTLTLLFGWILHHTSIWKKYSDLRIFSLAHGTDDALQVKSLVQNLLDVCRIEAKLEIVTMEQADVEEGGTGDSPFLLDLPYPARAAKFNAILRQYSHGAGVVFFPIPPPPTHDDDLEEYAAALEQLTADLPPTVLVRGHSDVITTEL